MERNFRNAVFGGFNREDVMAYITKISAEYKESGEALEQARSRLAEREAEQAGLREEADRLAKELEGLRCRLQEEQNARQALEEAAEERDSLRSRVTGLEREAEEYRRTKEQVAQIELDAHKRAGEIQAQAERQAAELLERAEEETAERARQAEQEAAELTGQARQEAEEIRGQLRQKLQTVAEEYTALLSDFEVLKTHISGELRKMDTIVEQLPIAFHRLSSDIENLQKLTKQDK